MDKNYTIWHIIQYIQKWLGLDLNRMSKLLEKF